MTTYSEYIIEDSNGKKLYNGESRFIDCQLKRKLELKGYKLIKIIWSD
jgi:hypothetical protein